MDGLHAMRGTSDAKALRRRSSMAEQLSEMTTLSFLLVGDQSVS
jgi:hypothetical protein